MKIDFVPHSRPSLGEEEAEALRRVVLSGMVAEGPEVAAFEHELGGGHVTAVAHGTGALHLTLKALGAAPGTNVILPSYCCVSVLNAVLYSGASPVLVDCRPDAPDLDLEQARQRLGADTAAVLVPHLFGRAVPLQRLPVPIVEDATQSLGAPGVGRIGAATVYSFYATKMIAGGEGGAVVTRSARLARFVRDHRSYDGRDTWALRYNYKMTDLSAAMLRVQLRKLPEFQERRRELAGYYRQALAGLALELPAPQAVEYRFVVRLRRGSFGPVEQKLQSLGVGARPPVYRPIHHYLKLPGKSFPHSEKRWRTSLSLPLYPSLRDQEAEHVVQMLRKVLS